MIDLLKQNLPVIIVGVVLFAAFAIYMAPDKTEIIAPLTITGLLALGKVPPTEKKP
jgi:hypothetical protein